MVAVNMRRPPAWQCLFEQLRSSWIGSPFRIGFLHVQHGRPPLALHDPGRLV